MHSGSLTNYIFINLMLPLIRILPRFTAELN